MEDKVSNTYKSLYHYTTISGALGIIKSNQLWATHCRFLNDTTERIHALDAIYHHMHPKVLEFVRQLEKSPSARTFFEKKGGSEHVALQETKNIVNAQSEAAGNECYVVSLCGETTDHYTNKNGLLSQWRGYGKDGGAAIVFDTKKLETLLEKEVVDFSYSHFCLADLFYEEDFKSPSEAVAEKISTVVNYGIGVIKEMVLNEKNLIETENAYNALANLVSRYKHRAFKEENEVRIIAWPIHQDKKFKEMAQASGEEVKTEKTRYFRESLGGITPYIKLLEKLPPNAEKLPIKKIIIGPHKDKEKRKEALEIALRGHDIEVDISEIPYVG